jgi:polysaccharide pyruvyl transferase WcaK-like protein
MQRFLLYGHGGSYNHGGEAIVRATAAIIRGKYPLAHITLSSHYPEQDREYALAVDEIIAPDAGAWEKEKQAQDLEAKKELAVKMYAAALERITPGTVCLAVGGDNYCYPSWYRQAVFQERAAKVGAKSILWGASVEPGHISPGMAGALGTYTQIIARESITAGTLKRHGIESAVLPDPAFSLAPEARPLPDTFQPRRTVGINLSPLAVRLEREPGIAVGSMRALISHIAGTTALNIALIPHVVMPMDDDYQLLSGIYHDLPEGAKRRACLIDGKSTAGEYKYVISQCAFLVCARTHASIAAYSSGVPALVLGYSNKAAGIAHDLGVGEYVLDITRLERGSQLIEKFEQMRAQYPKEAGAVKPWEIAQAYARYI